MCVLLADKHSRDTFSNRLCEFLNKATLTTATTKYDSNKNPMTSCLVTATVGHDVCLSWPDSPCVFCFVLFFSPFLSTFIRVARLKRAVLSLLTLCTRPSQAQAGFVLAAAQTTQCTVAQLRVPVSHTQTHGNKTGLAKTKYTHTHTQWSSVCSNYTSDMEMQKKKL